MASTITLELTNTSHFFVDTFASLDWRLPQLETATNSPEKHGEKALD
jgi:hypothetical protein